MSPATEDGSRPVSRGTFFCFAKRQVPKEKAPRLSASLRYVSLRSGQTCVTQFRLRCRPTRYAATRLRRCAQTNGGKSDHEATLSYGSVARSPNSVPQARTHGWVRIRAACENFDEMGFSQGTAMGNSYQFNKKAILHPHSVSPLVPTPATTSAWGWQLHRRVQLHRHQICGNVFERSVEDAQ